MSARRIRGWLALLTLAMVACGGPAAPASAPSPADADVAMIAIGELEAYQQQACACAEAACAEGVKAHFAADFVPRYRDLTGTEAQAERAGAISRAMITCLVEAERRSIATGELEPR